MRNRATTLLAWTAVVALAGATPAAASAAPTPAGSTALTSHPNSCWPSDHAKPVLDGVELSTHSVDVESGPARVHVTVAAHDEGGPGAPSGVKAATVHLANHDPVRLRRRPDGSWQATFSAPRGARRDLSLQYVDLRDAVGNTTYADDFSALGADPRLTATGTPDTTPPTVTDLSISPRVVDVRRHPVTVTISGHLADDLSGPRLVIPQIELDLPIPRIQIMGGDAFSTSFVIPRWVGSGQQRVMAWVADRAGNFVHLDRQLAALGSGFTVRSGPRDTQAPRVLGGRATPTVDVRKGRASAKLRVEATDNRHVTRVVVRTGGRLGLMATLVRLEESGGASAWAGRLHVPACVAGPVRVHLRATAYDRLGHGSTIDIGTLRIVSRDHRLVHARATAYAEDRRSIGFAFDKPVHGISTRNVQVTDTRFHTLPGHWTCRAGGHPVDCLTRSVDHATFRSSSGLIGKPRIDPVFWEPNGHYDVLDVHGNPVASGGVPLIRD